MWSDFSFSFFLYSFSHSILWKMNESERKKGWEKNKTSITLSLVLSEFFLERIIFQVMIPTTAFWRRKIFYSKSVDLHHSSSSISLSSFSYFSLVFFSLIFSLWSSLSFFSLFFLVLFPTFDENEWFIFVSLFPGYWSWRKIPLIEKQKESWETKEWESMETKKNLKKESERKNLV